MNTNPVPQPRVINLVPQVPRPQVPVPQTQIPVPRPQVPVPRPVPQPSPRVLAPQPVPRTVPSPRVPMPQPVPVPKPVPSPRVPMTQPVPVPKPVPSPRVPLPVPQPVPVPKPVPSPRVPLPVPQPVPRTVPSPRVPLPVPRTVPSPTVPAPQPVPRTVPSPRVPVPVTQTVTTPLMTFAPEMIDDETIIELANRLDMNNFLELLRVLDDYYHNDESLISDERYDEVISIFEAKYGRYNVVGAQPRGEMVDLPYYLGSLRKVKEETELSNWFNNFPGPYIIEDKIDGLTLLIVSKMIGGRRITSAYTRGGGVHGKDVSHTLAYLQIPRLNVDIAVRGELVINKEAFERVGTGYRNPRNLVSGAIGAKNSFNPALAREFSFYAYRIVSKNQSPESDIAELKSLGFQLPNPVTSMTLTKEQLENYFRMRQEEAPYEMDGLVIYQNVAGIYPVGSEPRHVVAFKTSTQTAVTTVRDVVWRASKDRKLKPRVYYDVTALSGADLNYASGYNARYIVNNRIGPGAKILLTRSGDVIPKILSVIEPAPNGPLLPDPNTHGTYTWNENQVEFILTGDNGDVIVSQLQHFLKTLRIKNTGRRRLELLVVAGIKTIDDLLRVSPEQLRMIPGIGSVIADQLSDAIAQAIKNVPLARIMDASGIFSGIGERRFDVIVEAYPNFLDFADLPLDERIKLIQSVKGFNQLAVTIAELLPSFRDWLRNNPMITIQRNEPVQTLRLQPVQGFNIPNNKLAGQSFVFSGFRDDALEDRVKQLGGRVATSVSGNTTAVVMKDLSPENIKGKAQNAQARGIPLIARADFERQYLQ